MTDLLVGGGKPMKTQAVMLPALALLVVTLGSAGWFERDPLAQQASRPEDEILFSAVDCGGDLQPLPSAKVFLDLGDSVRPLGATDAAGRIFLKKSDLEAPGAKALYFCRHQLELGCTALRLDRGELLAYRELNVQVTGGLVIIDRKTKSR